MEKSKDMSMRFSSDNQDDIRYYIQSILNITGKVIAETELRFGKYFIIRLQDKKDENTTEKSVDDVTTEIVQNIGTVCKIEYYNQIVVMDERILVTRK